MKTAIVTVSSPAFARGTLVLLHSFLSQNPWFSGEIIVLDDGMSDADRKLISSISYDVRFETVSEKLTSSVDHLIDRMPEYTSRKSRFYSIDTMAYTEYDRVLYCDSDMIFLGSVEALFKMEGDFLACGDGAAMSGKCRDRVTFEQCDGDGEHYDAGRVLADTFNDGLMMFGRALLAEPSHQRLISLMETDILKNVTTGHTDQVLFNHVFAGRQKLIDPKFNFLLAENLQNMPSDSNILNDIIVAHFNGPAKPWDPLSSRDVAGRNPLYCNAQKLWLDCYMGGLNLAENT